jgi:hypothetical protein
MLVILIHQKGRGLKRLMRHSSHPVFMRSGDGTAFADARSDIGHSLTAHARDVAGNFRRRLYEEVAQGTRDCHIVRAEGDPNALLGVIVLVDRVVAPPSAISVGRLGDPSRGLGCCSRCCGWDCDFYFSRLHLNTGGWDICCPRALINCSTFALRQLDSGKSVKTPANPHEYWVRGCFV